MAAALLLLSLIGVGAEITLCPPPLGDGRGFLFIVSGSVTPPPTLPAAYTALLAINLGTPLALQAWYDKSCGLPWHAECVSPFNPGTAVTHTEALGFPISPAALFLPGPPPPPPAAAAPPAPPPALLPPGSPPAPLAPNTSYGIGFILPGWAGLAGDALATALSVGLLTTAAFTAAPQATFPVAYNLPPGGPGLTLADISAPSVYDYSSGPVLRAAPLPALCSLLFPGAAALGGSGFVPGFALLPPSLPASIAGNPMVPAGSVFLAEEDWFLPGVEAQAAGGAGAAAAAAAAVTTISTPPGRQWPLPLPKGVAALPATLYNASLRYSLGSIVSTGAGAGGAAAGAALPGPFYQVTNRAPFAAATAYLPGALVQHNNAIYAATAATTGVVPTAANAPWALAPLPGPASPAASPFFAPVPTAAGLVILYLPNVLLPFGAPVVVVAPAPAPAAPSAPALPVVTPVVVPVLPGGPVGAPPTPTATPSPAATRVATVSATITATAPTAPPATSDALAAGLSLRILLVAALLGLIH